ncbi:MAG: HAMP domain-containing sensor histidine kinase [Pseudomonadota bacterium]
MMNGSFGNNRTNTLLNEYSSLLGDAVLRRRARSAEQSARLEAEMASRVKSEFIANMSHELRTPLNTVIGFSKILSRHKDAPITDEDVVQYAELIHDSAGQLLAIINDILDISKMQSGRYTLDHNEFSLADVADAAVEGLRSSAKDADVEMSCTTDKQLPPIRGDAAKLKQVLTNIISNAIKFTPAGGEVAVRMSRLADVGVCIHVTDTGVGMTEEEIDIALTPFGQVDGSHTRWREGTGLGLPIARALVELHGGEILIQSEKSQGTEVTITLPSRNLVATLDPEIAAEIKASTPPKHNNRLEGKDV